MANLKDLRNRISSVQSTQKITKAMKMVAASKLRRAQDAAEATRPYAERMESVLGSLAASMKGQIGAPKLLAGTGREDVHLIVVATSERGLCGGFNANIVKAARQKINNLLAEGKDVKIITIGKKGRSALRREFGGRMIEHFDLSHVKNLHYGDTTPITERILELFERGEFDVCTLFYAKFQSALVQVVTGQQLIPASFEEENGVDLGGAAYDYEPDETEILEDLLPRNLGIQIFRGLLENAASEQGARMTAMDNATRNAGEMIDSLRTTYNRTRQAVITNELIEIISGAEAL
ncbi:F0F1 ATP synthase subunit gamma [Luteithermobacter gelatinilyticus]|uniref:F0F1 ATP synthase subunit gamma n=1 Tax=Luteithermobacter gelatinilyticus TaxID=2582913 RepID=UPI001106B8A4|nr:F0F1 ATP synthase subunit gamma [Luteithermobacter gelatinilyticus]